MKRQLGKLPVQDVATALVVKVLVPIGTAKPETASRLRGRVESVLGRATGLMPCPITGLGPRGINRRLDTNFDPLPLTAILFMGIALKPAITSGDLMC